MNSKPSIASVLVGLSLSIASALATAAEADFAGPQAALEKRLDGALRDLASERDRIAREKIPLSKEVAGLESEVAALRLEASRLVKVQDSTTIDLSTLRKQVDDLEEQDAFVSSRLTEFLRDFEARLNIAEIPRYEATTSAAKLAEQNVSLDADGKREAQIAVVRAAFEHLQALQGGDAFDGEALSPEGVLIPGRFVAFGPSVFFASSDGEVAGLVEHQLNAADPVVVALPGGLADPLFELAQTGKGELPLDPTLGKALKIEQAGKSIGQYVDDGGPVGLVIIGLGIASFLLTGFKTWEILGFKVVDRGVVDSILEDLAQGSQAAAAKRASQVEGIAGEMLELGVRHAGDSREILEELMFEQILSVRPKLERYLPFLSIVTAAAPLLGLLGTVIGMINTFNLLTIFGTGDAKSLSSGISEALVTTALGLIVAIPTLLMHGSLVRLSKGKLGQLEELSVAFINGVETARVELRSALRGSAADRIIQGENA
ncbi:MAG: MotA/TolQ/ExbB proton channel family protein [Myxococcota bacterium]